jgi:hypothetical protein
MKKSKPCKTHRFVFAHSSGRGAYKRKVYSAFLKRQITTHPLTLGFRCSVCGEIAERPATVPNVSSTRSGMVMPTS